MRFLRPLPTPRLAAGVLVFFLATLPACSSDDGGAEPGPLASLVGTWDATSMVVTSRDDPEVGGDLIEEGASFTLEIRSSGRYTASLSFFGQTDDQRGDLEVSGSTITLDPDDDVARDGTWSLQDGTLIIDAATSFDFNQDGTLETADLHLELERR